jgi:hypothetical protein
MELSPFSGTNSCLATQYILSVLWHPKIPHRVGFEVFTAVVMKSVIFWDMTPCSPLSCTRRFGGTYCLHLQGRRIVQQTSEQAGTASE